MTNPAHSYLTVTADDLEHLHRERVRALELDHARTMLLCRETVNTPDEAAHFMQLAELERRIALHVQPADPPPVEPHDQAHLAVVEEAAADNLDETGASNGKVTAGVDQQD